MTCESKVKLYKLQKLVECEWFAVRVLVGDVTITSTTQIELAQDWINHTIDKNVFTRLQQLLGELLIKGEAGPRTVVLIGTAVGSRDY